MLEVWYREALDTNTEVRGKFIKYIKHNNNKLDLYISTKVGQNSAHIKPFHFCSLCKNVMQTLRAFPERDIYTKKNLETINQLFRAPFLHNRVPKLLGRFGENKKRTKVQFESLVLKVGNERHYYQVFRSLHLLTKNNELHPKRVFKEQKFLSKNQPLAFDER